MTPENSFRHQYSRTRVALVALVFAVITAALAFSSRDVSSQGGDPQRRDLDRVFSRHERLSLDPGQVQRQVKQTRSLTLTTSRGTFEMTLEPHDMRAPDYVAEAWGDKGVTVLERAPVRTYKGTVQGLPGAQARMTIDEQTVEGLIITPDELFFLEPTKRYSGTAAKTDFVFYSGSDLKESAGECGNTAAEMVAQHSANVSNQTSAKGPQPEAIFGPALEVGIALEADFEYFSLPAFGGSEPAVAAELVSIMNQVEGIYNTQMGLQFLILHTRVWTTASDPYTSPVAPATTVEAGTALNEFRTYYNGSGNAPPQAAGRDIAHLWTGRDLAAGPSNGVIGIAYQPGLDCPFDSQGFGYGISENRSVSTQRPLLTAHEIGHNLSASHVNTNQGSDCMSSIMNPSLSSSQNFCGFSRDEITGHALDTRTCLEPLNQPGCTYVLSESTQIVPAGAGGNSVDITTQPGCNWAVAEGEGWVTITNPTGTTSGSGTINYTVTSNGVCGARTGLVAIGDKILTVQQAGNPNYLTDTSTATAIALGQTLNGDLSSADCSTGLTGRTQAYMDRYKFFGMAGQKIKIAMNAVTDLDTYLYLLGPSGFPPALQENDDIQLGVHTNSRIKCVNVTNADCADEFYTLPETGTYIIISTSFANGDSGGYSLTLTSELLLLAAQVTDSVGTAAAVNSVTFARTSNANNTAFSIVDTHNFSADQTTRLILFTSDLGLAQQQNPIQSVLAVSAGGQQLVVEHVGPFTFPFSPGFPAVNGSYIIVALKRVDGQALTGVPGSFAFTVTRSTTLISNVVTITIAQ